MHEIILFIELPENAFETPETIGLLYLNRLIIDENAAFEVSKIFYLEKSSSYINHDFKEIIDKIIIDAALKSVTESTFAVKNMKIHIIYAGVYYFKTADVNNLFKKVSQKLRNYDITEGILTMVTSTRNFLITSEKEQSLYKDKNLELNESVNDDLETCFFKFQQDKMVDSLSRTLGYYQLTLRIWTFFSWTTVDS